MASSPGKLLPRFPSEIFCAILDELIEEDLTTRLDPRNVMLTNPSAEAPKFVASNWTVVCKSWYYYLTSHLWQTVILEYRQCPRSEHPDSDERRSRQRVSNLLACLRGNPTLSTFIKEFRVYVRCGCIYGDGDDPDFEAVCVILGWHLAHLSLHLGFGIFDPSTYNAIQEHSFTRHIHPICSSTTLTNLALHGPALPIHLLEVVPALREASFGNIDQIFPLKWEIELDPRRKPLPFRLRKVTFFPGDRAFYFLAIRSPEVFKELEELYYYSLGPFEPTVCLPILAEVAKKTLRVLELIPQPRRNFNVLLRLSMGDVIPLPSLVELKLEVLLTALRHIGRLRLLQLRFLRSYTSAKIGFPCLRHLYLSLSFSWLYSWTATSPSELATETVEDFKRVLFDPEAEGWVLAHTLFGPALCPSLRTLDIQLVCYQPTENAIPPHVHAYPRHFWGPAEELQALLDRCTPVWPNDPRDLKVTMSFRDSVRYHSVVIPVSSSEYYPDHDRVVWQ